MYKKIAFFKCPLCGLSTRLNKAKFEPNNKHISLGEIQFRECRGRHGFPKVPDDTLFLRSVAGDYPDVVRNMLDRMSNILLSVLSHPPVGLDYKPEILVELEGLRNAVKPLGGGVGEPVRDRKKRKWGF